ncbi:uncharacterized protein TNCV_5129351 [Trichonephila clavipes]|nr:uncharacterized protein TNCV_5129351 [Trichonephila clavipes]
MEFKGIVTFSGMSGISSNLFPFEASLGLGNREKSGGLRSADNGGCSICQELFDNTGCVKTSIIVNKNHEPCCAYWCRTLHRHFMKRVIISMYLAAFIVQLSCAHIKNQHTEQALCKASLTRNTNDAHLNNGGDRGSTPVSTYVLHFASPVLPNKPFGLHSLNFIVKVNGDRYRALITNFFIPELSNHDVQELWFQQDGATCHTARATIDFLKDTFGVRLISRFGPGNWPPRSCDLTPLDYFLWGYVKSLVYADKPQTLDHLEDNICRVISDIWPQMLEKFIENWTTSEPALAVLRQKSYLKCNATRLCFE